MPADTNIFFTLGSHTLVICSPGIMLEIDKTNGDWRQIVIRDCERNIVPAGGTRTSFDLHVDGRWLSREGAAEVIQWEQRSENGQFAFMIEVSLGSFRARHWIRVDPDGMGFQRMLELRYRGEESAVLRAIDLSLPAIRLHEENAGLLLFPNHLPFSSLDLDRLSRLAITREKVDADYASGCPAPGGIETFPDNWNGVIGVYHEPSQMGLYSCLSPAPVPVTFVCQELDKGYAISAQQRQESSLQPGDTLATASQLVRFFRSTWTDALEDYQKRLPAWGFEPPKSIPSWVTGATFYETAITQWRGCAGLARALPALRDMGIDALYLLPIWSAAAVTDEMKGSWRLDLSWQGKTLPHRITDFEMVDPQIGSAEEVRDLVSAAHNQGIKVLLDFVFHGVSEPSWLIQRRPHWLVKNAEGNIHASHAWEPGYSLDWAHPEVQDFFVEFGMRQVKMFDLDGLRIDAPFWKESNWNPSDGRQPFETNLAGLTIVERLRREIRRINPEAVLLCETHGPAFIRICDILNMDNVICWLARLGRDEISAREMNEYLKDLRFCYPEGTLLQFSMENHNTSLWHPSPRALRCAAVSRSLFAVATLAADVVSIYHAQERGQEEFIRQFLAVRKSSDALTQGLVIHRGVQCKGERQLAWLRHLGAAFALVTASFDPLWSRTAIEIDPSLLVYFDQPTIRHQRLFPTRTPSSQISLEQLQNWQVELGPYAVVIDLFEQ